MKPILTTILLLICTGWLQALTFTVNTLDNTDDGTCDGTHCSLREAINAANANAGTDQIVFSVAGTIDVSTNDLPVISDQVDIIGTAITVSGAITHGLTMNSGAANSSVTDLTITLSTIHGISGDGVSGLTLTNCSFPFNGTLGAPIGTSFGNGVSIINSSSVTVIGCNFNTNRENGIYMESSPSATLQNNVINTSGFHGMILVACNGSTITGNTSNGNGLAAPAPSGFVSSSGIIVVSSDATTISGNTCDNSLLEAGIYVAFSNFCMVTNNTTCGNHQAGIRLEGASSGTYTGNTICNNTGSGSTPGILITTNAQNNSFQNNTITGNECSGVQINSGTGNQVIENTMSDNACIGIDLNGGNNNFASPTICAVTATEISGSIADNATLHFYLADQDDPCQGTTFIGSLVVTPGNWIFPGTFDPSMIYAVSATSSTGNTSEFACDVGITGVAAGNDGPHCEGSTLQLAATGGGTYSWMGPNGFSSTQPNPSITNVSDLANGTYSVTVTSGGCSAVTSTDVTIVSAPDAGTDGSAQVCNTGSTSIDLVTSLAGTPDGGGSWNDDDGSGVNLSNPNNVDLSGVPAGDYDFTYTVMGDPSCPVATAVVTVTVNSAPDAGMNNSATFCTDPTVDVAGLLLGSPQAGGSWNDDDGTGVSLANPNSVDFTGVPVGDYNFTYTVTGTAPCSSASATVTISISGAPNAGTNGTGDICNSGSTILDLVAQLGGSPDAGGSWSDDNGAGVSLANPNAVDFNGVAAGSYDFTYTITASSPSCSDASSVITVTVAAAPNAGTNGSINVCNTSTADLFAALGGSPDVGGSWNDDNGSGVNLSNPNAVDFNGVATGNYNFTYTVTGVAPCGNVSAVVSVTVSAASDPGSDGSISVCNAGSSTINLADGLTGSPDGGGSWSDDSGAGVSLVNPTSVDFTGIAAGNYLFTYTIPAAGLCPAVSATATVTVAAAPDAGTDASQSICEGASVDFVSALSVGQLGGNWTDNDGSGVNLSNPNNVDFTGIAAGTYSYTYTVNGVAPCSAASATLTITVEMAANAGGDGSASICNGGTGTTSLDLGASLTGSPDVGGSWSDDSGAGVSLANPSNVNFTGVPAGVYTFTYSVSASGSCPDASAMVTVTVNNAPSAGTDNFIEACTGDVVDFFASLIGPVDLGGNWTDNNGSGVNLSNPSAVSFAGITPGVYTYTYTVNGVAPCGSSSAVLTVSVVSLPNAGTDGFVSVCSSSATPIVDLFSSLGGNPDFTGIWNDDNFTGVDLSNPTSVNFFGVPVGTYNFSYTVDGGTACPSAVANVLVSVTAAPNAGNDGAIDICETGLTTNTNLFAALSGGPDVGGIWTDDDGTGVNLSNPSNVNFAGITPGFYTFSYTFADSPDCPSSSAQVFVIISEGADAGENGIIDLCESDDNSDIDLAAALGGTPDIGGIWTDDNGAGVSLADPNSVDFTGITPGIYQFSYTVNSANPICPSASASVFVNIEATPNAGMGSSEAFCADGSSTNLFSLLSGSPDAGGNWSDDDGAGVNLADPTDVDFSAIAAGSYNFTYIVSGNNFCPAASATVNITIAFPASAGDDNSLNICNDSADGIDLFASLNGSPDAGGTWTDVDGAGVDISNPVNVNFTGVAAGTFTFSYEVVATDPICPNDQAILTVTVEQAPNAGMGSSTTACNSGTVNETTVDLVAQLTGSPDMGGSWSDDNASGVDISDPTAVDFTGLVAGTYNFTYTVTASNSNCQDAQATISVVVEDCSCPGVATIAPDPLCNEDGMLDLSSLELSTDPGVWTISATPSGTNPAQLNGDIFDATTADTGAYTITYTLDDEPGNPACPQSSSQTLEVFLSASAGVGDSISICNLDSSQINLFDLITDEDSGGTWSLNAGSDNPDDGAFDTSMGTFTLVNHPTGLYQFDYIIPANAACPADTATATVLVSSLSIDVQVLDTISCAGDSTGSLMVTIQGGAGLVSLDWQDIPDSTTMLTGLGAGSYIITVEDEAGCLISETIMLSEPDSLGLSCSQLQASSGPGIDDGIASIDISGGTAPYTIIWDGGNGPDSTTTSTSGALNIDSLVDGTYNLSLTDANDCQATCQFTISATSCPAADTTFVNLTTCDPMATDTVINVLQDQVGCDSIVVTITELLPSDTISVDIITCDENMAGIMSDTLTNQFGCDSIFIQNFIYSPPDTTELSLSSCQPEDAGVFTDTFTNEDGCDSLVITTVIFDATNVDTTTLEILTCDENMAGSMTDTLANQFGCDSILIQNFIFSPPDTTMLSSSSCQPEDAGVFTDTFTNEEGCDSLVITTVIFDATNVDTTTLEILTCDENMEGSMTDTLTNQFGCDSILIQNFVYSPPDTTMLSSTSCQPEDVGVFTDIFTNEEGCDSLVITTIVFDGTNIDMTSLDFITCDESMAGTLTDTLTNQFGCDSILVQNFIYSPPDTTMLSGTSCQLEDVGVFTDTFTNENGCDSLVITTIVFDNTNIDMVSLDFLTCDENMAGMISDTLTNQFGCDSILIQNFIYSPPDTTNLSSTSCQPEDAGVFTDTFTNEDGCDSLVITTVVFDPGDIDMTTLNLTTCDESMAGTMTDTLTNQFGCDSILIQNISFVPLDSSFVQSSTCVPEEAGTFTDVLSSEEGCDSIVIRDVILISALVEAEDDDFDLEVNGMIDDDLSTNDLIDGNVNYTILDEPSSGSLSLALDGRFNFEPDLDFTGLVSFSYQVCSIECPEVCDTAQVSIQVLSDILEIPNAFSPNGDGINEVFVIPGIEQFENPELIIVNRWGSILWEAQPYTNNWDGRNQQGDPLPEGTYYYILWLDVVQGLQQTGPITIIR